MRRWWRRFLIFACFLVFCPLLLSLFLLLSTGLFRWLFVPRRVPDFLL
jgi:hypothetical protein